MASEQALPTADLRSDAKDHRRAKEQRQKWALGQAWGPGTAAANPRPARVNPLLRMPHSSTSKKHPQVADEDTIHSDSSAEEEVEEASAAPAPDAEIAYSYDAARGPNHGSQILSMAVAQAVERFESRVTDKLIKEEYEVLNTDGEHVRGAPAKGKKAATAEDDDYEFV